MSSLHTFKYVPAEERDSSSAYVKVAPCYNMSNIPHGQSARVMIEQVNILFAYPVDHSLPVKEFKCSFDNVSHSEVTTVPQSSV